MANNIETALYITATPIGNLDDITKRAVHVLKNVDVIACEDTRNTSILLEKYSISSKLISCHKFCEAKKTELFLNYLKEGKSVALVSDAGTPLISDPGAILVREVRKAGFKVVPVAGVCAVTTLLSAIDRNGEDFKFVGFLPKIKNQIEEIITKNKNENLVFYESPNRLIKTLEIIANLYPQKHIAIGRELTKKFEEIKTDTIENMIDYYKQNPLKGEIAVMLYKSEYNSEIDTDEKIKKLKSLKLKDKEIANILSVLYEMNKNAVYKKCIENVR